VGKFQDVPSVQPTSNWTCRKHLGVLLLFVATTQFTRLRSSPDYGSLDKFGLRMHYIRPANTFCQYWNTSESFLGNICWFSEMYHSPKQLHYVRCEAVELLCNSTSGPLKKNAFRPCTALVTTKAKQMNQRNRQIGNRFLVTLIPEICNQLLLGEPLKG